MPKLTRRDWLAALGAPVLPAGERFAASGFFRLEKRDRWWLVTPEGSAFLSLGLNHAEPGLMRQEYNRAHWLRASGAASAGDARFLDGFRRRVEEDLRDLGLNTLGCHSPARRYWNPSPVPYIHSFSCVEIPHPRTPRDEEFRDVFSPAFEAHCEQRAKEAGLAGLSADPLLLGYSFTDCPILTEGDAAARQVVVYGAPRAAVSTWPRVLRNLPSGAPGKQAYVQLIRERYAADLRAFNRAYAAAFGSFDALASAVNWRPAPESGNAQESRDNDAFLAQIVERYCRTMARVVRRHDPNHLILGDKWNGNTGVPDFLVRAIAPHVDLFFYQWYGYYGEQKARLDEWAGLSGKPLFNGDSSFSVASEQMPRPLGPLCRDEQERAEAVLDFARRAFGRPDFVGWTYCGWLDTWKTMPGKEMRQHSGLSDPFGARHQPVAGALKSFSAQMYAVARAGRATLGAKRAPK